MSLCSLIYNNTQGISSANDLTQIINEYWKSVLFKFVMISQTGIFNAVRITNSTKCVWYWLSTGIQWKVSYVYVLWFTTTHKESALQMILHKLLMNIGNQFCSSLSWLVRQAYLMQSELPTALNVSDTDYPLEYNERSRVLFIKKLL